VCSYTYNSFWVSVTFFKLAYLTLRSALTLNNPQNSEMKFNENMKLHVENCHNYRRLHSLNNFTTCHNIIIDDEKYVISKKIKNSCFEK
jgi:hypothetical protein